MKEIYFITSNEIKHKLIEHNFRNYDIKIHRQDLDGDFYFQEPQVWNVADIALFAARYACKKLGKPVITSDMGYYFNCFKNGFPGPYIKWANEDLSAEDLLGLVKNKTDRSVLFKEGLAYVDPEGNEKVVEFSGSGQLAHEPAGTGTSVDKIMQFDGMKKVAGLCTDSEIIDYWSSVNTNYTEMGQFVSSL